MDTGKLLAFMAAKGYNIERTPGFINIVYVEGADAELTPNSDAPDMWNDRRIVFTFDTAGQVQVLMNVAATTEPGKFYTYNPMNKGGAGRIVFGQYRAWKMGFHGGAFRGHPALIQCKPIKVHRDFNRDFKRTGDRIGIASGLNQHGAKYGVRNKVPLMVGKNSAGCLVGQVWDEHLQFIALCKSDPRFIADENFIFESTIIAGDLLHTWTNG